MSYAVWLVDVATDAGRATLKKRLMDYADRSIRILKDLDAQGMIVWDVEGQEFTYAVGYVGEPRSLPGDIDAIIDEFFKKFTDAGLRVGVTIRPQRAMRWMYHPDPEQIQIAYPGWAL